jgi:hypothetical protein
VDLKLKERHIKRAQPTLSTYTLSLRLLLRSYPATHALSLRLPPSRTHLLHGHTHISLSLSLSLSRSAPAVLHARRCSFTTDDLIWMACCCLPMPVSEPKASLDLPTPYLWEFKRDPMSWVEIDRNWEFVSTREQSKSSSTCWFHQSFMRHLLLLELGS